jgi:moderate conductance mechanosensitive channel
MAIQRIKPLEVKKMRRWVVLTLLTLVLTLSSVSGAWGQLSLPTLNETPPVSNQLPPGVKRVGNLETAPVQFEGKDLFWIASAVIPDRKNQQQQVGVEQRARQIQQNLNSIVAIDNTRDFATETGQNYITLYDPKSLKLDISTLNGQTVILARDARRTQPIDLLTVTDADARFYGISIPELALRWKAKIEQALQVSLADRIPETLVERFLDALKIALIILLASFGLWLLRTAIERQGKRLKFLILQDENIEIPCPGVLSQSRAKLRLFLQKHISLDELYQVRGAILWLLFWGQFVLWFSCLTLIFGLFPQTYGWSIRLSQTPVKLLVIWCLTSLLNRLGDLIINRFIKLWEENKFFNIDDPHRRSLRLATQGRAFKGLKTFFVVSLGLVLALGSIGVAVYSLLAGGALLALVISFAAQSLIKDLLNGCLILWEDQFAIGDWVSVGNVSGLVENMNLRITQLRDAEGRLITIPNNLITQVVNFTRSWSQVNFKMRVPYHTDVERVLQIIARIAAQLYADPEWHSLILEPPQVLGIEHISYLGLTLRALIKTQPNQQWQVAREFRLRLRLALEQQGITVASAPLESWENKLPVDLSPPDFSPPSSAAKSPDQEKGG